MFIALVFGLIEVMVEFHTEGGLFLIDESELFGEASNSVGNNRITGSTSEGTGRTSVVGTWRSAQSPFGGWRMGWRDMGEGPWATRLRPIPAKKQFVL